MRERIATAILVLGVAGLPAGCAYVTAQPVKPGDKVNGIRVYDVKPLLVVSGEAVSLQFVPNYSRGYALRFGAFLAKNHFQATMSNGMLTNVNANLDSTDFISLLRVLADKLPSLASPANTPTRTAGGIKDRFQVYDIIFDDEGNLVALRPLLIEGQHHLLKMPTGSARSGTSGLSGSAAQGLSGSTVIVQPGASIVLPQQGATTTTGVGQATQGQATSAQPAQE